MSAAPSAKLELDLQAFALPMPQAVLGTVRHGGVNWMALGWVSRVNFKPPLLAIGVHQSHASHAAIVETGQFSVCFPSERHLVETDYVGLVSAGATSKAEVFTAFRGRLEHAPMAEECPLCIECTVYQTVTLPTNTCFIGEIKGVWSEAQYCTEGVPDPEKIKPFTLTMPDNRYWALGSCVGKAWHAGKALKRRRQDESPDG